MNLRFALLLMVASLAVGCASKLRYTLDGQAPPPGRYELVAVDTMTPVATREFAADQYPATEFDPKKKTTSAVVMVPSTQRVGGEVVWRHPVSPTTRYSWQPVFHSPTTQP